MKSWRNFCANLGTYKLLALDSPAALVELAPSVIPLEYLRTMELVRLLKLASSCCGPGSFWIGAEPN